jgi:15-cis-phytoene synthase
MDSSAISQAHALASDFVRRNSLLHYPSMFFTPEHKQAAHAVYAYFRTADNLVDEGQVTLEQFRAWRELSRQPIEKQTDPLMIAFTDIRSRYHIDPEYEQAVLDGLELDMACHRYETLDELKGFCYNVATAPFLLAMLIVGFRPGVTLEQARPYMENMGIAMQLTDILRDVGDDLDMGRIYLPKSELAAFGLTYAEIEAKRYDERFKQLMKHITDIARDYYSAGWPILDLFPDSFRLAGGFGLMISRSLLNEIEARNYDVFSKRVKLPKWKIFWLLMTKWPAIYWPKSADRYFR